MASSGPPRGSRPGCSPRRPACRRRSHPPLQGDRQRGGSKEASGALCVVAVGKEGFGSISSRRFGSRAHLRARGTVASRRPFSRRFAPGGRGKQPAASPRPRGPGAPARSRGGPRLGAPPSPLRGRAERERESQSAAAGRGRGGQGTVRPTPFGAGGGEGCHIRRVVCVRTGLAGRPKLAPLRAPRPPTWDKHNFAFAQLHFFLSLASYPSNVMGGDRGVATLCSLSLSLSLSVFQTHPRSPPTVLSNARESGVRPRRGAIGLHLLAQPQRVPRQAIDIDSFPSERPSLGPPGLDPVLNCHREAFSGNFGAEKGVPSVSRPNDKREKREILIKRRPEISRAG